MVDNFFPLVGVRDRGIERVGSEEDEGDRRDDKRAREKKKRRRKEGEKAMEERNL